MSSSDPTSHGSTFIVDDPEPARSVFGRLYNVASVDTNNDPDRRFRWRWNIRPLGSMTLISGEALAGSAIVAGAPSFHVLALALKGSIDFRSRGKQFNIVPGVTGAFVNADAETSTITRAGTQTLNIRVEASSLAAHAASLLGAPSSTPPVFDPYVDLSRGAGSDILRLAHLLKEATFRPGSTLASPYVMAHIREALTCAVIVGHSSSLRVRLEKPAPTVNARAVKQAAELLAARAAEPISIAEVAAEMGVGLRSLERSFKAARGCTLRDFLSAERLELARRRLVAAAPGTTVTQVLYAAGFSHPGEFSRAYTKRFGELPSETLRRSLGVKLASSSLPLQSRQLSQEQA